MIDGIGVFIPTTQRIGIVPDIIMRVDDPLGSEGRDEVLKEAVQPPTRQKKQESSSNTDTVHFT